MHGFVLLVGTLVTVGTPRTPTSRRCFSSPIRWGRTTTSSGAPARGPLGRRATLLRAEQGSVRRHDHPGRRRGDPREARRATRQSSSSRRSILPGWTRTGSSSGSARAERSSGIHSTANTYQNYPAFGAMLGASFDRRPWRTKENPQTKVRVIVVDRKHPATRHLGESFEISDDIYQFKNFDRSKVQLLLRLDPESLDLTNPKVNLQDMILPGGLGQVARPGTRLLHRAGGLGQTWKDPRYRTHLINGIRWTMRLEEGD